MLGINYGIILSTNEPSPCRRFVLVLPSPAPSHPSRWNRWKAAKIVSSGSLQPEVVHFCPVSARISLMRLTVARFHCPRGPNIRRSMSFRARGWKQQSAVRSNFFLSPSLSSCGPKMSPSGETCESFGETGKSRCLPRRRRVSRSLMRVRRD